MLPTGATVEVARYDLAGIAHDRSTDKLTSLETVVGTATFMTLDHATNVITSIVTGNWYLDTSAMTHESGPYAVGNPQLRWPGMDDATIAVDGNGTSAEYHGEGVYADEWFQIVENVPRFYHDNSAMEYYSGSLVNGAYVMDAVQGTVGGTARLYWVPSSTNTVPAHVNLASPIPFGPVIGGVQSLFRTDGTNLWWKNVNNVETPLTST